MPDATSPRRAQVSTAIDSTRSADPGLQALVMLLHLQGVAADAGQIRHRLGMDKIGAPEMLRCAKDSRAQGASLPDRLVAACQDTLAGHRGLARRRVPGGRQGRRGQGFGPVAAGAPTRLDDAGRTHRDLGRPTHPDDPPGWIVGCHPPVRHHLVSGSGPQISPSPGRGAGRVVLPAAVRPGLAAVLPGGDRQGVGSPGLEYPRRPGRRSAGDLAFRDHSGHPADLFVRAYHQPHRRRTRRAPVPPSAGFADGLLPGAARRRFGGAGAGIGEHPQFSHQLGPDFSSSTCSSPSCSWR